MIIRCWGARGSIPVSGKEYVKYGGDTTCIEIETKNGEIVIIDAGSGIRRLGNKCLEQGRKNISILFTHSHWDHLLGFPFFKPIYIKGTTIKIYGCTFVQKSIKSILSNTMNPPFFPVKLENVVAEFTQEEYKKTGTWGHSTYIDALTLAIEANVKQLGLFHHNQDRSDQALDEIVRTCRLFIRDQNSPLECFAVQAGMEMRL